MKTIGSVAHLIIAFLLISTILLGCETSRDIPLAPTVATFFPNAIIPTSRPTVTSGPSPTITHTPEPTPVISYHTIPIFDDELASSWELNPEQMSYQFTNQTVYSGTTALQIIPDAGHALFYIVLAEDSTLRIPSENIYGFSFYLSSGSNYLNYDDYAVTVQGSNINEYWDILDESARIGEGPMFSETLLAFFGINNAIPPHEWVKVEVPIHEQLYDPPYKFFTGFYLKNGETVQQPIYVDQIELIVIDVNGQSPDLHREVTPIAITESLQDDALIDTPTPSATPTRQEVTAETAEYVDFLAGPGAEFGRVNYLAKSGESIILWGISEDKQWVHVISQANKIEGWVSVDSLNAPPSVISNLQLSTYRSEAVTSFPTLPSSEEDGSIPPIGEVYFAYIEGSASGNGDGTWSGEVLLVVPSGFDYTFELGDEYSGDAVQVVTERDGKDEYIMPITARCGTYINQMKAFQDGIPVPVYNLYLQNQTELYIEYNCSDD